MNTAAVQTEYTFRPDLPDEDIYASNIGHSDMSEQQNVVQPRGQHFSPFASQQQQQTNHSSFLSTPSHEAMRDLQVGI